MSKKNNSVAELININDKYFKSDSIEFGRIAKEFFKEFCDNYITQNQKFFSRIEKYENHLAMPCMACEDCNLSAVICAIDKITNIHLTEFTFNMKNQNDDKKQANRRIDLWCRKETSSNPYDFFLELKNHNNCIDTPGISGETVKRLRKLEEQVVSIKTKIRPDWGGKNIYIGLMIIHGWHNIKHEIADGVDEKSLHDLERDIISYLNGKHKAQVIFASWKVPQKVKDYINKYRKEVTQYGYNVNYDWISITGFVVTKEKGKK